MTKPKVSIIIPNYNHSQFLQERLESVLNQTFQDFEIILLDDRSTDASKSILEDYQQNPKVSTLIINSENSGSPFKQWFKGINEAKGKFIWIAESDDYSDDNFLKITMNRFDDDKDLDVVFTGTQNVDEDGMSLGNKTRIERHNKNLFTKDFKKKGHDFLVDFMPNYCIIRNASSVVFKKSVISSLSEHVINFKTVGDFYFWVTLCLENRKFGFINDKLNFMRGHKGNVRQSEEKKQFKKEEYEYIKRLVWKKRWFDYRISKKLLKDKIKEMRK